MADNLSKKFALFLCCLMTMQALRLVISTAGFCAIRFHIDCELFNILISRLVNAVLMSQLFGNWLGDLFVFGFNGRAKLWAASLAFWAEFICFCFALYSICHTECGHLTGFYWSMVMAYFWWKVGEAPAVGISGGEVDYYFAGFTLSGVWASCLKGLVMRCVTDGDKTLHFNSVPLGDVNVSVVGRRSVKTTVDYRAAMWLYVITIVLTLLMCLSWTAIPIQVTEVDVTEGWIKKDATDVRAWWNPSGNKDKVVWTASDDVVGGAYTRHKGFGKVGVVKKGDALTLKLLVGTAFGAVLAVPGAMLGVGVGWSLPTIVRVFSSGDTVTRWTVGIVLGLGLVLAAVVVALTQVQAGQGNVDAGRSWGFACGGAATVLVMVIVGPAFILNKWTDDPGGGKAAKRFQLIFGIVGALGGFAAGVAPCVAAENWDAKATHMGWVWSDKWKWPWEKDVETDTAKATPASGDEWTKVTKKDAVQWENVDAVKQFAPMIGLGAGLVLGALVGRMVGACKGSKKRGTAAGAFIGSFFGLLSGEMANAIATANPLDKAVGIIGFLIVVFGLGTVYSIYPGMAPCSITQFQYFNIIDILILILSAIAPMVIMGADLGGASWRLGKTVKGAFDDAVGGGTVWVVIGLLLVISTLTCEIIVLSIMQHPDSNLANKVTTSGWRAVLLTVTMVTSQLTSSGVGFGCVAVGGGFNDGINNVNSTLTLWTMECCGVLGEGYLTELKRYEAGKWPTQGMGKWATFKWWNNRAFGNAWAIWCCIGTTDLRRDIMLCRQ